MTPDVLVLAAEPEAAYSVTQLWIIAIGSCIATAVAFGTLPLASPRTGKKLGLGVRFAVAPLPGLAAGLGAFARSATRNYEDTTALYLYIIGALTLVALRVIFAKWIKRSTEAYRAGTPMETSNIKVAVVLFVTLMAVFASIAVILAWLPTLWA